MNQEQISNTIKKYFFEHPNASDTVEGILNWWIGFNIIDISQQAVQQALDDLCRENVLLRKDILSSQPVYALKTFNGSRADSDHKNGIDN